MNRHPKAIHGNSVRGNGYYVPEGEYLAALEQIKALKKLLGDTAKIIKSSDLEHAVVNAAFPGVGLGKLIRRTLRDIGKGN